jgi:hypothetical protein
VKNGKSNSITKTKQNKTKTKQNKTKQNKKKQNKTKQKGLKTWQGKHSNCTWDLGCQVCPGRLCRKNKDPSY